MMPARCDMSNSQFCEGVLSVNSTVSSSTARIEASGAIAVLRIGSTESSSMMR